MMYLKTLEDNEQVGLITIDHEFMGIWAREVKDVLPFADVIREYMATLLDNDDYDGTWVWKFSSNLRILTGYKI